MPLTRPTKPPGRVASTGSTIAVPSTRRRGARREREPHARPSRDGSMNLGVRGQHRARRGDVEAVVLPDTADVPASTVIGPAQRPQPGEERIAVPVAAFRPVSRAVRPETRTAAPPCRVATGLLSAVRRKENAAPIGADQASEMFVVVTLVACSVDADGTARNVTVTVSDRPAETVTEPRAELSYRAPWKTTSAGVIR